MPRATEELLKDAAAVAKLKYLVGSLELEVICPTKKQCAAMTQGQRIDLAQCHVMVKNSYNLICQDIIIQWANFMASAPQMASLIAELSAKLREREEENEELKIENENLIMAVDMNMDLNIKKFEEAIRNNEGQRALPTPPKKES